MDLQLKNRLSLVTGSTAGIGFAIAGALVAEGANIIVNGRSQGSVDDAISKLSAGAAGDLIGFAGDLSKGEVAEQLAQEHPGVEILVNNWAFLSLCLSKIFQTMTGDVFMRLMSSAECVLAACICQR